MCISKKRRFCQNHKKKDIWKFSRICLAGEFYLQLPFSKDCKAVVWKFVEGWGKKSKFEKKKIMIYLVLRLKAFSTAILCFKTWMCTCLTYTSCAGTSIQPLLDCELPEGRTQGSFIAVPQLPVPPVDHRSSAPAGTRAASGRVP